MRHLCNQIIAYVGNQLLKIEKKTTIQIEYLDIIIQYKKPSMVDYRQA